MAVNYAEKYSEKVDERFSEQAKSGPFCNSDYDFTGVRTVKVYSVATAKMNDYSMSGSSRYGTPEELDNSLQELTLGQDRSFTFTIDKRNESDTMGAMDSGRALSRQLTEVTIPEIDRYRFSRMILGAGTHAVGSLTKANAYEAALNASAVLTDKSVPSEGRIFAVSPSYLTKIKQDSSFVRASDMAQGMAISGSLGAIDGMNVMLLPSSYLMSGVDFLITHPIATTAAQKLAEYKVHDNAPGISGYLIEGRIYHDAFVLDNKKSAIYVHHGTIGSLTVESAAGSATGATVITVKGIEQLIKAGAELKYKVGATQAAAALDADVSGWTKLSVTATTGGAYVSGDMMATGKLAVAVAIGDKAYMSGVCDVVAKS